MAESILLSKRKDIATKTPPQNHPSLQQYEPHLKSLAKEIGDMFLCGREHIPWLIQHAAADFQGVHDLSPGIMTMVEYIQLAQKLNSVHPICRYLEVLEDWVEWDVKGGIDEGPDGTSDGAEGGEMELRAAVWQIARVVMPLGGTVRDGLRLSRWKRRPEGVWLCYHYALWRCDPVASGQMAACF